MIMGKKLTLLSLLVAGLLCSCSKDDGSNKVSELRLVGVRPSKGYSGQIVKVLGRNFSTVQGENEVTVGGKKAKILDYNAWDLTIVLPENEPGEQMVEVTTPKGSVSGMKFTYEQKPENVFVSRTLAGMAKSAASVDGYGEDARFVQPEGIAMAPDGSLYVFQRGEGAFAIRQVTPEGSVSTLSEDALLNYPWHGSFGPDGALYIANKGGNNVLKYQDGTLSVANTGSAVLNNPMDCKFDADGNMYVISRNNNFLYKIKDNAILATYEISNPTCMAILPDARIAVGTGTSGFLFILNADGTQDKVATGKINGISADGAGNIYLCDVAENEVKCLYPSEGGDYTKGRFETVASGLYPSDVYAFPDGNKLYVSSASGAMAHTILVFEKL